MKKLFLLFLLSLSCEGAVPVLHNFNTNHFDTNGSQWRINLSTNILNSFGYNFFITHEYWNDGFSGSANTAGTVGQLGWTPIGTIAVSNAPGHFGLATATTTASAGNGSGAFLSNTTNTRPPIPPLIIETKWTNRFIWRVSVTNDAKIYIMMQNAFPFGQTAFTNGIGIWVDTTNGVGQILGTCSSNNVFTTTNLGTIEAATWYTNEIWSTTAGTIGFRLNSGAGAFISENVPTNALTPFFGIVKSAATTATALDMDRWTFIRPLY